MRILGRPILRSLVLHSAHPANLSALRTCARTFASDRDRDGLASTLPKSDGPLEADLPSEDDLLETIRRLEASASSGVRLPLLVIDSMLPGQRLSLGSDFDRKLMQFLGLGELAVCGATRGPNPGHSYCHARGVTATLEHCEGHTWKIIGRRPIALKGAAGPGPKSLDMVQAEYILDDVNESDVQAAKALPPLVDEWCEAVRRHRAERFEGQLKGVLADLGPMPGPGSPGRLAFWVAALVNPLPALGVAFEIRPRVLAARSVHERVSVAREGIEGSIGHVTGARRLF